MFLLTSFFSSNLYNEKMFWLHLNTVPADNTMHIAMLSFLVELLRSFGIVGG